MYKKGEAKSLTFEWNEKEKTWKCTEEEKKLSEQFGYRERNLNQILLDVHFVSVVACGKDLEKVVLFYSEPAKEKSRREKGTAYYKGMS